MKFCKKCGIETYRYDNGRCKPCYLAWNLLRCTKQRLKDHPPRFCKNCNEITERSSLDRCIKCARIKSKVKADEKRRKKIEQFGKPKGRHEPKIYEELRKENEILIKLDKRKCVTCMEIKNVCEFTASTLIKNKNVQCRNCQNKRYNRHEQAKEKRDIIEKNIIDKKIECKKCKIMKDFSCFSPDRRKLLGIRSICKECTSFENKNKRSHDNEFNKNRKNNANIYVKQRLKNDELFKLVSILRGRLRTAIKKNYKSGSAVKDLGCTVAELKIYLESKFKRGMTWENHGKVWHIDHIIALSTFDLTVRAEYLKAVHYTNLQPLTIKANLEKGNKIPKNHQCSLLI